MASRSVFVLATVLSVQEKFAYPCCTRCRKRVRTLGQDKKFSCSSCKQYYEGDEVHYRFRVNLMASDRSRVANVTMFGSCLDIFFGASATEFMRFLGRLQSDLADDHTVEPTRLVHQAVQQCFVGSMLKFGFRLSPPCRTESQILRSSPVNLGNVVSEQQMQKESHQAKLEGNQHNMPSVLANLVVPCVSVECQTILGILQDHLERVHTTVSCTPRSQGVTSVHAEDVYKDPDRKLSHDDRSSRNCGVSGIHCSGATGLSMLTSPLVLTCDLEADHCSTPRTEGQCSESAVDHDLRNTDIAMTPSSEKDCFEASQDLRDITRTPRQSQPLGATKPSPALLTQHEPCGYPDCRDTDASQHCPETKWSQLEDLPSSEDLSAFLADLALDSDFTGDEEGRVAVANEQCAPAPDRHNEWESLNELNTESDCHNQWGSFNEPSVVVDELQKCPELTDLGIGDPADAEEGLGVIINEEDAASGCHDEMESFNRPIDAVGKLHSFTELTDLSLDGLFTGDEGLVATFNEETSSHSSGCHAEMRSCNDHKLQNYTELKDLALDDDLTGDDEEQDAISNRKATNCYHEEMRGFNEPIENFTELTDLPSSEDIEAFLADMDDNCFVEENDTCPVFHSPTKTIQTSILTSDFSNYLKSSAFFEKTSFTHNKPRKGDLHSEVSIAVEDGSGNESSCRPLNGKDIFESNDYVKAGHDGVNSCSSAGKLSEESGHQERTHNSCSTPSVPYDKEPGNEDALRVAINTNKLCRANKRAQESKFTPNNLRVALLRKLTWSGRGYSVSSPTLSPLKKIRRKGGVCRDVVCETPEQGIHVGAYSEELFTDVEVSSSSSACDSCSQDDSSVRPTEFTDVFACGESAGVPEPSVLDSSSVCYSSGEYGCMRQCCAQEVDKSVTDEKSESYLCSVSSKGSFKSDSPSCFGSPELFSPLSSSPDNEGSPNLFSSENSDDCSISCEASGSVLLFSSQASHSGSYLSSCGSESFSNVKNNSSICHSTPVLNSRREAKAASTNRCRPRALHCSTPQSWDISGTALTESPLMFSQLSNSSLVNST